MYRTQQFICFYTEPFLAPNGKLRFQQVSCNTSNSINLWVGVSFFFILRTHNFEGSIGNMLRIVRILGNLSSVDQTINYSGHSNIIINVQNRVPIYRIYYLCLCMPILYYITYKYLMIYVFRCTYAQLNNYCFQLSKLQLGFLIFIISTTLSDF